MKAESNSVSKLKHILLVTVPPDPDDDTISALREEVLVAMANHEAKGLILDVSAVETMDSFLACTVIETVRTVALMGGRTALAGMRADVAVTATQLGYSFVGTLTALDVDRAFDLLTNEPANTWLECGFGPALGQIRNSILQGSSSSCWGE